MDKENRCITGYIFAMDEYMHLVAIGPGSSWKNLEKTAIRGLRKKGVNNRRKSG